MTGEQLRIGGTAARRRRGIARQMLDRQLAAWKRAGVLAGDEHAATRAALRDAAEALDAARDALRLAHAVARETTSGADDVSRCANRLGECSRRLLDMLTLAGAGGGDDDGDAFDAFLSGLGGPAVRD